MQLNNSYQAKKDGVEIEIDLLSVSIYETLSIYFEFCDISVILQHIVIQFMSKIHYKSNLKLVFESFEFRIMFE